MKKIIQFIKCLLGNHIYQEIGSFKSQGFFGSEATTSHYICSNCKKDLGWSTTESLVIYQGNANECAEKIFGLCKKIIDDKK
jgi:DNA-directed RNA polymerase subunit RPC12/RpoP